MIFISYFYQIDLRMTKDSQYGDIADDYEENSSALDEASLKFRNIMDGTGAENKNPGEADEDLIDIF